MEVQFDWWVLVVMATRIATRWTLVPPVGDPRPLVAPSDKDTKSGLRGREMKNVEQQEQSIAWSTVATGTGDTLLEHHPATPEEKTSHGESFDPRTRGGHGQPAAPLIRRRRARRTLGSESSRRWSWSLP